MLLVTTLFSRAGDGGLSGGSQEKPAEARSDRVFSVSWRANSHFMQLVMGDRRLRPDGRIMSP